MRREVAAVNRTGVVIALGGAQTLAWGSSYYLPAILAMPMARSLGLAPGMVFGAFSGALVVAALVGPLVGRRIDRHGGRGVLAASSLVFAAGLALLGLAQDAFQLFAAWLVIGLGMSLGLYEAAFATLARLYGDHARGAITGITLLAGFASTVCWPLSAWLDAELGWRATCLFWAGAHLAVGLPVNRLLVPKPHAGTEGAPHAAAPAAGADGTATRAPAAAHPRRAMWLLACIFTGSWFVATAMAAHLPWLLQEAGASATAAIAAAAMVGPAQVAGRLLEFGLLRHVHPLLSARLAASAHPLGALALLAFGAPAAIPFALLHGAGNGILTIAKGTLPLALFGPGGYGFRQGVLMVPARFAQAGAPLLFALLMTRYGANALLLSIALALAVLAALLALVPAPARPGLPQENPA
ncbi:MFS transporter [Luteimonas sp. SJ-92]|uniref:MFS transporter n=1 Tax=Luteimonas salinisoli TaxID=2752307 RepID=A0A853JBW0_9GAMM|nr:MFS transporter [Luteimonas salinisoli]